MSSSIFKDLEAQRVQEEIDSGVNQHESEAREWAREQEIPYSPPELLDRDKGVRILGRSGPMWFESREHVLRYLRSQRELQEIQDPEQELTQRIASLEEVISVHAIERRAELRDDPTVDRERIPDIVRIETHELRRERDQLNNQLRALNVELGFGQELGLER